MRVVESPRQTICRIRPVGSTLACVRVDLACGHVQYARPLGTANLAFFVELIRSMDGGERFNVPCDRCAQHGKE